MRLRKLRGLTSGPAGAGDGSVVEYVYLDDARLSSYVDQLRAPVTYDKVPGFSVELGIPIPTAKAETIRVARAYTPYEQVAFLEQRLTDNGQLARGRWRGENIDRDILRETSTFRMETCLARRVIVSDGADKLGVWVSRYDVAGRTSNPRTLLLFEGVHATDEPATYMSSYSRLLLLLVQSAGRLGEWEVMGDAVQKTHGGREDMMTSVSEELAKNPLGFLEKLDSQILLERCIRTLYRVRHAAIIEAPWMRPIATTLAYPIYVVDAPASELDTDPTLYANDAVAVEMTSEDVERDLAALRERATATGRAEEIEEEIQKVRREFAEHRRRSS